MEEKAIRKYIEVIRKALLLIEEELDGKPVFMPLTSKPIKEDKEAAEKIAEEEHRLARSKHAEELFAIDCWPTAVPPHLLREPSLSDKVNRANAVLDMTLTKPLQGLRVLDYGCGEGFLSSEILKRGVLTSTGFDITHSNTWLDLPGVDFHTDREKLPLNSFDCIFLYDVLDHVHEPVDVMSHVKSLLAPGGVVYVRCHPWCSKHASHLFKIGLNKAFIHLFLSWEELVEKGYTPIFTRPEIDPIKAYHYWFSNFKIVKETFQRTPLNEFFQVADFKQLIWDQQQIPKERHAGFIKDMEIDFVDYCFTL